MQSQLRSPAPTHLRASFRHINVSVKHDRMVARAFLGNLFGGGSGGASPAADPRGAELRNELILLTTGTELGSKASTDFADLSSKASPEKKKKIAETVRPRALWKGCSCLVPRDGIGPSWDVSAAYVYGQVGGMVGR